MPKVAVAFTMAIPATLYAPILTQACDLDFILPHWWKMGPSSYKEVYRRSHREKILDNGVHELGSPCTIEDMRMVWNACSPTYMIVPDKLGDCSWNLAQYQLFTQYFPPSCLAVVLTGADAVQRNYFMHEVQDAGMLCLPFKEDRLAWLMENPETVAHWRRIHLLGMSSVAELSAWRLAAATYLPCCTLSVDTTKPIKWGLRRRFMDRESNLRGQAGLRASELLSIEELGFIAHNINYLRGILA